jgi:hypothetical protein
MGTASPEPYAEALELKGDQPRPIAKIASIMRR